MPSASFDPKIFLARGGPGRKLLHYKDRHAIFSQGEAAACVHYVQKGRVKLTVTTPGGKEAVVGLFGPGQFFGHECLAGQKHRVATAICLGECSVTRLEKAAMNRALREPPFVDLFMTYLLTHIIRVEGDLVDHLSNSSEKRLARNLLLLARFAKTGKLDTAHVAKVSQETLAEMVGTTRARINFFMNKFRKLGFIDYNGGLTINRSLLNFLLQED
jgi:CRP/FNR family transcriptional regulator, cyclic AMP receptor protein